MSCILISTMSRGDEDVPEFFAWRAKEDRGEGYSEIEGKVEPDNDLDAPVHSVLRTSRNKDVFVLEKDRELNDEH